MISDRFMNTDSFGFGRMSFKLEGHIDARPDIPQWRKNRTDSRSCGRPTYMHTKPCKCGSLVRRVWNNECFDCYKGVVE